MVLLNNPQPEKKPIVPETIKAPEAAPEPVLELEKTKAAETPAPREGEARPTEETATPAAPTAAVAVPRPAPPPKPEELVEVENIMSKNLEEMYSQMSYEERQKFKIKGEETAYKIWQMLRSAKIQVKKVIDLIRDWLKLIPGINRYFLEQEAKIKADEIVELTKKKI